MAVRSMIVATILVALLAAAVWVIWIFAGDVGLVLLTVFALGVTAMGRSGYLKQHYKERESKQWELIGLLAIILSGVVATWLFIFGAGIHGPIVVRP